MPSIAEIRAAAKARLEAQNSVAIINTPVTKLGQTVSATAITDTSKPITVEPNPSVKQEPAPVGKPLSFAEKMALKKQQAQTTTSTAVTNVQTSQPEAIKPNSIVDGVISMAVAQENKPSVLATITSMVAPVFKAAIADEDLQRQEYLDSSEETQTAYRDIKSRINALNPLDGTHLETAMSELKVALLQNPSACLLMYDEDLGVLASALRKMVHEDMVASTKPPKEKKEKAVKLAALQIPLTQEMLEAKFSDL